VTTRTVSYLLLQALMIVATSLLCAGIATDRTGDIITTGITFICTAMALSIALLMIHEKAR